MKNSEWKIYRTRFLVRAKQLTAPLVFVDVLGREHRGNKGDYLMEFSDGNRRIAPRVYFEDVYVAMEGLADDWPQVSRPAWPIEQSRAIGTSRRVLVS
ncbi:MAG: hypothetical protein JO266_00140 [Acidobacteria bacterium]|nr:hypothetical protein [Acidobacteriota bacterium]MBV8890390.1 hypothetical protein [Acidobacteriota bacterium]